MEYTILTAINPTENCPRDSRIYQYVTVNSKIVLPRGFWINRHVTINSSPWIPWGDNVHRSKKAQMRSLEVCRWPVSASRLSRWFLYLWMQYLYQCIPYILRNFIELAAGHLTFSFRCFSTKFMLKTHQNRNALSLGFYQNSWMNECSFSIFCLSLT